MVYNMLMHNNLELPGFKTMQKETTFEAFRQRAEHLRLLSEISSQFAQTLASLKNLNDKVTSLNDDERKQEEEEASESSNYSRQQY